MTYAAYLISIVFGVTRFVFIDPEVLDNKHIRQSYQAFVHIWIGVLGTTWWLTSDYHSLVQLISLTVIELLCAFLTVSLNKFNQIDLR